MILHPIAVGVAFILGQVVPRRRRADQHLVVCMAWHALDGIPAQPIAARIELRGDHLAWVDNRHARGAGFQLVVARVEAPGHHARP